MKINPTRTVSELLTALSCVIDIEGNKHLYHGWRVAIISGRIAKKIATSKRLKDIFYAGLLHDVGGVELSHHIIHYLKRADKASRRLLLSHPIIGAQFISNIPQMSEAAKLILDHHEWINGAGYPRAKTKKYIPLGSQIIRISDSIDIALQTGRFLKFKPLKERMSLNINREYSKALFKRAFEILEENKFFYKIYQRRNVPKIFNKIKNAVGFIHIPSKIDAIGSTLEVIAQIIDMKHPYTSGHSLRVSRYAIAVALAMNLGHDEVTRIKWAGFIHDMGKLSVPRRILDKPTPLSPKEFQEIKRHAQLTYDMMKMIPTLKEIAPIASGHHEHFDGTGYPRGLKGNQIPQGARVLAVCDAFDAMTSNRPYHQPLAPIYACRQIQKYSGRQFDPEIAKSAIPIFKNLTL